MGKLLSAHASAELAERRNDPSGAVPVALLDGLLAADGDLVGRSRQEDCDVARRSARGEHERLADAFLSVAARRATHPAVVTSSGSHSYQAVADAARRIATCLRERCQLSPGGRVLLLLANGPEYLAALYGTLIAGGVAVPMPPNVEWSRLARTTEICGADVVLTTGEVALRRPEPAFALAEPIETCRDFKTKLLDGEENRAAVPSLAMILFTSGSSGEPKGVMLSDANLLANAQSILSYLPITSDDRALAVLPFYHAFGNSVLQTHVLRGATLVVDGSPAFPSTVIEALARHDITSLAAVPEVYHGLLAHSDFAGSSLPALRYLTVAGGAASAAMAREVARRIAPAEFFVMYGQTEATARLAYVPPRELANHPDSVGRAIPGVTLRIADDAGREVPPGTVGELQARGPNVMLGYWQDPQGTSEAISSGWLRTGDLAVADEGGLIYLKGRRNQLVKVQGMRLHPAEVEEVITRQWPGCRAIVVPYQQGESTRLALFVVPSAGTHTSVEDLRRHCLRELPRPKVPSHIEILSELPLHASLKVDRAALTRRAESTPETTFPEMR